MKTKIYGLTGHPVRHSLSPAMQNAAFGALGIDAEYRLFDVEPEGLEGFLAGAPAEGVAGLNVTIPHKIHAREYIERHGILDENARRLGAVNTISILDGAVKGFNTDGPGFYRSLIEDLGFEPEGKKVCVLGAGGAARAVIMYLGNAPQEIYVFDIDKAKTEDLKAHYKRYFQEKRLVIVEEDGLKKAVADSHLLINATPLGMKDPDPLPVPEGFLHSGLSIYDLVYNRPVTSLVKKAALLKIRAVTGLGMLLYQGAIAFEIWTAKKAPVDIMRKALKKALKDQG